MKGQGDDFARELTLAMKRVEAPTDFAGAVMEAAGQEKRSSGSSGRMLQFSRWQRWIGSMAASLLLAGVLFGGIEHRRAMERERAERDFAQSLEITDRAMEHTRHKLQRAGIALDD